MKKILIISTFFITSVLSNAMADYNTSYEGTKFVDSKAIINNKINDKIERSYVYGDKGMFVIFNLKKGAAVPVHFHESEQITYVNSGKMKFIVGKEKKVYILNAGDTIVVPSFVPHETYIIEDTIEYDIFSPIRKDWINGTDNYFNTK